MSARRVGVLAPHRELPGELEDVAAAAEERVALWEVVTASSDDHSMEALLATSELSALVAGVERMRRWRPEVVVWCCTSGSFVRGRAHALSQIAAIEAAAAGVPATSTSLAFVEALAALDVDEVAIVGPYPADAVDAFAAYLGEWGIAVRDAVPLGCVGPTVSEQLDAADVERAIVALGSDVAVLLPDTAVWGIEILTELAPRLPMPLLVANQVTLWHAFDLIGIGTGLPAFDALAGVTAPGVTRSA